LYVNKGVLRAEGTLTNPIHFDIFDPMGTNNSNWNGIQFVNARTELDNNNQYLSGCRLSNINVHNATTGIILSDSSLILADQISILNSKFLGIGISVDGNSQLYISESEINHCNTAIILNDSSRMIADGLTIDNGNNEGYGIYLKLNSNMQLTESVIKLCNTGIFIDDSDYNLITGCQITNCYMGIYFAYDCISRYNRILNNNLSYNLNVAIFVSVGNSGVQHNKISFNTINYNQQGLHIGNGGNNDEGYNVISGNDIKNNIDIGVWLSQDKDSLYNNTIENNGTGVMLYRASANHIRNNIIKNSPNSGVILTEQSSANLVEYNNIIDNYKGVKITFWDDSLQSENNHFRYNNLTGNIAESFNLESGPQQSVEYNTIISADITSSFINSQAYDLEAYNNYWGTSDTTAIDSIIADKYDNFKWGRVLYKPFAEGPDNSTPISPPVLVIKRQVNGKVVVNWKQNQEQDLAGYKVYYGNPLIVADNGIANSVVLNNIDIATSIRVTAYDNEADGLADLYEGHESGFTYAIGGPWAGYDNSVCSGENFIINTATAFEYQSLSWITLGDGTFSKPSELETYYMPGFADKELGAVNLILSMTTLSGITLRDTFNLRVLDALVLEAGNDTIITEGSVFLPVDVQAENYVNILWSSSGDGTFDDPASLTPAYTPGIQDISRGWVNIAVTISSGCGSLSDDFILTIIPGYDISGRVTRNNLLVEGAVVLAYNLNDEGTRAVSMTTTDQDGKFFIQGATSGHYYIYSVPDPSVSYAYIPTYYAERTDWHNAYLMNLQDDVYDVDIILQPLDLILPQGTGSISGTFTYEGLPGDDQGFFNSVWFGDNRGTPYAPSVSNPYPAANHVILLMNPDLSKIIGWALSAEDGSFSFNNLPFGAYRLRGEKAGFDNKVSDIIYITPDNNTLAGVELYVDGVKKLVEAQVPPVKPVNQYIYPNPVSSSFNISGLGYENDMEIEIELINEKGVSVVKNYRVLRNSPAFFGPVYTDGLPSGIYFCVITSPSGVRKTAKISVY